MIPPDSPRYRKVQRWAHWLERVTAGALALAVAAVVVPGEFGEALGVALVTLLVAAPILRVALAGVRFSRLGDHRYVLVVVALLLIIASGSAIALWRG